MRNHSAVFVCLLLAAFLLAVPTQSYGVDYPETAKIPVADNYHGTEIVDNYRWLEAADDPAVREWVAAQEAFTNAFLDTLPQVDYLVNRFEDLWRYDERSVPWHVVEGERLFYLRNNADDEKSVLMTQTNPDAAPRVLIDPNTWPAEETMHGTVASRDGKYLAYGVAHGGDENPVVQILDIETGELLPDTLNGWQQEVCAWLPENEGFYYSANPLPGEVPEGEEWYWGRIWLHKLGTPASEDIIVFSDDKTKELWHWADVSEDGKYVEFIKGTYYGQEIYYKKVGQKGDPKPLVTGMQDEYSALFVENQIIIGTNEGAPRGMIYITKANKPKRKHWKVLIPEHTTDKIERIDAIAGNLYVTYMHNASTRIAVYDLKGNHLKDIELPLLGKAGVDGLWSRPEVYVHFSSFTYPRSFFKYDFETNSLDLLFRIPVKVNVDQYDVEQVWYPSADGTKISMFLVYRKDMVKDGSNPTLLYGYGGFNISETPYYSSTNLVWCEQGGIYALANLRGGGEYGEEWHVAGMLEQKQNVFDDFIAAAEYLIEEGYSSKEHLVISGGSNGGLLTGAALVQRPELFAGVESAVPLLDMLRYHTNKYANVWAEEYGSSDDPQQFLFLRAYSPYHNIPEGAVFPPTLIWASENDARVDPYHSRKMIAQLQAVGKGGPFFYLERKVSGHGGGTTLTTKMRQTAQTRAFLMHCAGMDAPEPAEAEAAPSDSEQTE